MPDPSFETQVLVSLETLRGTVERIEQKIDSVDKKFEDKTRSLDSDVKDLRSEVATLRAGQARIVGVAIGASALLSAAIAVIVKVVG